MSEMGMGRWYLCWVRALEPVWKPKQKQKKEKETKHRSETRARGNHHPEFETGAIG